MYRLSTAVLPKTLKGQGFFVRQSLAWCGCFPDERSGLSFLRLTRVARAMPRFLLNGHHLGTGAGEENAWAWAGWAD
jgi:hypothetical protein